MEKIKLNILLGLIVTCGLLAIGGEVKAACMCTEAGGVCMHHPYVAAQCNSCLKANAANCAGEIAPACDEDSGLCPGSFPAAQQCPTVCDYPGGSVPDGTGKVIICQPTAACKPTGVGVPKTPAKPATTKPAANNCDVCYDTYGACMQDSNSAECLSCEAGCSAAATTANSCDVCYGAGGVCQTDSDSAECAACASGCSAGASAGVTPSASTQGNIANPNANSGSGVAITDPLNINSKTPIADLAKKLINIILGLTGVIALLSFIYGGVLYMLSGVSPDNVKKGKEVMKWAVAGLFIIFSSYAILNFLLTTVLGVK